MALGAPVIFAGLILPVVQVSNLISQLTSAPILGGRILRKWYIVLAVITSAAAFSIVGIASYDARAEWLAALFLLAAAVIGICQGISTLAFQDLIGRILPRQRRTSLLFTQVALAGLFTVLIAFGSQRFIEHADSLSEHLELLWAGIAVTVLAGIFAGFIRETPPPAGSAGDRRTNATGAGHGLIKDFAGQIAAAVKIPWFRRFLVARTLFLSIEMAMPFYALHAATHHAGNHRSLSTFVIASSLGLVVGGLLWQRVAQFSNAAVMVFACLVACAAGGLAIAIDMVPELRDPWLHGGVFLLIATANEGTRNARKLYLVSVAPDEERPYYVALSNVLIGAVGAVVSFGFGVLAHVQNIIWPIWIIVGLNVVAGLYTRQLAESRTPAAA